MSHIVPSHLRDLHIASQAEASGLVSPWSYGHSNARTVSTLYPKRATTADEEPKIPGPKLFASLTHTTQGDADADLPTVGECAVHLELLEAFHKLRLDVIRSSDLDTTFGVKIEKKTVYRSTRVSGTRKRVMKAVQLRDTTWPTRRRQKWAYFLDIAVGRFKVWMKKVDEDLKERPYAPEWHKRLLCLPPLDVLMVWHAFLLNPHDYAQACHRHNLASVSRLPFPWKEVHAAINSKDWTYTQPGISALWTKGHVNMEPNLFRYLCEAGKASNSVSTALARYGERERHVRTISLGESLNSSQGLTDSDAAFLALLRQTELDKETNKPLVENVQRQASFVDKMHAQLWIRSPAVEGTLRRARDRYDKFLRLFRLYPGTVLVPTLDVDLAWHTHQCSAQAYAASVRRRTGFFINHDDKLGRGVLHGGMEETKKLFFMRFGEEYERCLCWDCEAMASVIEEADDGVGREQKNVSTMVERVRKDVEYYRYVEVSRRAGEALPIRTH
ncbi:hypothetical protein VTK56DRAFT_5271 [Thermocarpiscus australiensis]